MVLRPRMFLLLAMGLLPAVQALAASGGHKVEVRDAAAARAVVGQGGRLIADYGGFQLYDVPQINGHLPASAEVRDAYNSILLSTVHLDTSQAGVQALRKTVGTFAGKRMHLVQFAGPVQPAWRQALLDAGVQIVSYVPQNAYLVYGDSAGIGRVQAMAATAPHMQWNGAYLDDYKIHPRARPVDKNGQPRRIGTDQFAIQLMADAVANADTLKLIDQLKLAPMQRRRQVLNFVDVIVRLAAADLPKVAARPDVISIQPYVPPKTVCERQDQIVAGNLSGNAPSGPGYLAWLTNKGFSQAQFTASGFVVDLTDGGIDNGTTTPNHFGLYVGGGTNNASRVVYKILQGSSDESALPGCTGHGNINAHIIMGYDDSGGFPFADSSGYHYGLGVCPFASIGSSVIFDADDNSFDFDDTTVISTAYQKGARISNNSWGDSSDSDLDGLYSLDSQAYDALVRDADPDTPGNQEMVIVFAAGNDGPYAETVSPPGTAKNVITVGAAQNVQLFGGCDASDICDDEADDANSIIFFSGRGPCYDGRRKPDLMAPGTHVSGGAPQATLTGPVGDGMALTCFLDNTPETLGVSGGPNPSLFFPLNQQFYTASSGTSHSTPCVTGGCALVRQYFINNNFAPPSPAITKAFLMNSARYMTGAGADDTLWSENQGMGEMNLGLAFDGTSRILRDESSADTFNASGQVRVFTGAVGDPTKPFRVTVAWTDAPGSTTAGAAYNNDLDLTVTVGGLTYKGNVFSGPNSITGGSADTMNNVESVFLPAGVLGDFTVTITATSINSIGVPNASNALSQDFALVIYNASPKALAAAGYTLTTNEPCTNGAVNPGETVTVNLALQNNGNVPTTNLVATLLAGNGIVFPSAPQTFGALAAGASVNEPFTFFADGTCGQTLTAVLQLQDGPADLGTVSYGIQLGQAFSSTNYTENFADVLVGTLPSGWSNSMTEADLTNWTTGNITNDTPPNAAFCPDSVNPGEVHLFSPVIPVSGGTNQLIFNQSFDVEDTYDGGVLEIAIGSKAITSRTFTDILAAGGSFVTGGYNGEITDAGDTNNEINPLIGRSAWTGSSSGFITTTVNLPGAASGTNIQLRWTLGTDAGNATTVTGWWIENVSISQPNFDCTDCPATNNSMTSIVFPTNGYQFAAYSPAVLVTGLAPDDSSVTITNNGILNTTVEADDNGVYAAIVTLDFGTNILTATEGATNSSGSVTVIVTLGPPNLIVPAVADTNVPVSGMGVPGAIINLSTNGALLTNYFVVDASGNFSGSILLPLGDFTLTATETVNSQTSSSTAPVSVSVVTVPTPAIVSPTNGTVLNKVSPGIIGKGTAGEVLTVYDVLNGVTNILATTTNSRLGTFSVVVDLADGTNLLFATQKQNGTNSPSSAAVVVIDYLSPQILVQPENQTNFTGGSVTFAAAVAGAAPLSLFWETNRVKVPGADTAALTLLNLKSNAANYSYSLVASNKYGVTNSSAVTLNLVTNPFTNLAGDYYGLFAESNAQFESSGLLTLTLTTLGKFTARILNAGGSYSFTGALSGIGWGLSTVSRGAALTPLTALLNLNVSNGMEQILGTISAGTNWSADLEADRATFSLANPSTNQGKFTLIFVNTNSGAQSPGGDGYGTVTVSAAGMVSLSGVLPDNTGVAPGAVSISKYGRWPLYYPLYVRFGSLVGWIDFSNTGVSSFAGSNVMWFRTNADGKLSPGGFTNALTVIGSTFVSSNKTLLDLPSVEVILSGGNLTNVLSNSVIPSATGRFTTNGAGIPKLALDLNPVTGIITGTFSDPVTAATTPIKGVVFQEQTNAGGFFLGASNSGSFFLTPP
jgi:hypothetical protein